MYDNNTFVLLSNPYESLARLAKATEDSRKHVQFLIFTTNAHITDSTMAKEVIDLLALKVRGILRILHMPEVDDGEMRELTFRLGQTSKWKRIRLNDAPLFFWLCNSEAFSQPASYSSILGFSS